jgi:hypothetical protein
LDPQGMERMDPRGGLFDAKVETRMPH